MELCSEGSRRTKEEQGWAERMNEQLVELLRGRERDKVQVDDLTLRNHRLGTQLESVQIHFREVQSRLETCLRELDDNKRREALYIRELTTLRRDVTTFRDENNKLRIAQKQRLVQYAHELRKKDKEVEKLRESQVNPRGELKMEVINAKRVGYAIRALDLFQRGELASGIYIQDVLDEYRQREKHWRELIEREQSEMKKIQREIIESMGIEGEFQGGLQERMKDIRMLEMENSEMEKKMGMLQHQLSHAMKWMELNLAETVVTDKNPGPVEKPLPIHDYSSDTSMLKKVSTLEQETELLRTRLHSLETQTHTETDSLLSEMPTTPRWLREEMRRNKKV